MGLFFSTPAPIVREDSPKEKFFRKHKELVPYEDLIVGRKYYIFSENIEGYNGFQVGDEPLTYQGIKVFRGVDFFHFKDRYKEHTYYNGPQAEIYGSYKATDRYYSREGIERFTTGEFARMKYNISFYESEETLQGQEAARLLAFKLPEDNVHIIKSMLIGDDGRNKYPARIHTLDIRENYFGGGFVFDGVYKAMGGK